MAAMLLSSGCVSMAYIQDPLEQFLINQQPELAIVALDQQPNKKRDQALYHLNKATLLRMQGNFKDSNAEFEKAKQISEKLTALSLREQATAITVNDAMRSYLPPAFEQTMIYCFKIINYLELNDIDGARVETLQLDVFLKQNLEKKEPAFARYLSGMVYEASKEPSNALIDYRKAYQAYNNANLTIPMQLKKDLLRLTDNQGLYNEHQDYRKKFKLEYWPTQAELNQQGETIVILFNGLIPHKYETAINAQDPGSGQLHRIAIPFYEKRETNIKTMQIAVTNKSANGELFLALDKQAEDSLSDKMPGIITRAIARVSVKNNLSDNMEKQSPLLGVLTNIATFLSEQADTRAWYSLPQEILIGRIASAPGAYNLNIRLNNATNSTVSQKLLKITPKQQQKRFYSWHWAASTVISKRDDHARITYSATIHHRID